MTAKTKFYAVAVGRKPGIYQEWYGPGGAQAQVNGVPGARFKGFTNRAEAQAWLARQLSPGDAGAKANRFVVDRPAHDRPAPQHTGHERVIDMVSTALERGQVVVFTDGACTGNPGPGGWAAVLRNGEHRKEISGGYARTTNNRMELTACIAALRLLQQPSTVLLLSDSRYVTEAIEKGWARRWQANHWMRNNKESAENPDLWAELLELCKKHQVNFVWLRGHAGHPENERCDQMAVAAAHQPGLPADPGYNR